MASDGAVDVMIRLNSVIDDTQVIHEAKEFGNKFKHTLNTVLSKDGAFKEIGTATNYLSKTMRDVYKDLRTIFGDNLSTEQLDKIDDAFSEVNVTVAHTQKLYRLLENTILESAKKTDSYRNRQTQAIMQEETALEQLYAKAREDPMLAKGIDLTEKNSYAIQFLPKDTKAQLTEFYTEVNKIEARIKQLKTSFKATNEDLLNIDPERKVDIENLFAEFLKSGKDATQLMEVFGKTSQTALNGLTDEYNKEKNATDKLLGNINTLYNTITRLGKSDNVADFQWRKAYQDVNSLQGKISELQEKLNLLVKSKKAFVVGDKATTQQQEEEYNKIKGAINNLNAALRETKRHLKEVRENSEDTKTTFAGLVNEMSSKIRKVAYTLRAFNYLGKVIIKPFQDMIAIIKHTAQTVKKVISVIKSFAQSAINAIKSVAKKAFSVVRSLLSSILSKVKEATSHFHGINISIGGLFKTARGLFKKIFSIFTRFGLGFRSLFALVRRLRSTFIEMYKAAAEQIPEINTQVSYLMTLINQLKGSLVTMFQPLISSFFPDTNNALDDLTKKVVDLANTVGSFMAGLTGQGFIYKFVADEQDYAASVAEAADKTKDATKATKEYKRELMGFDQINRLSAPDEDKTDSESAYDPTANAKGHWEKVPITDKNAKELAKKIKELWEKVKEAWKEGGDFTNIGKKISEWIAKFFDKAIDFIENKLKDFGIKLTTALATFLNGLLTKDLGNKIGEFVGKLINTIQAIIRNFFAKFDWHPLGEFLAASLNRAIKTWDAKEFGKMIADFFIAAISTAWSFVKDFDFEELGKKLSDAINNFFSRMSEVDPYTGRNHWEELGQTISNAIKGVYHTITETVKNIDWKQVVTSIITVFKNIDWKGIADAMKGLKDAVWDAIKIIFTTIKDAIPDNWADQLKEKIKSGLTKLKDIAHTILTTISNKIDEISWSEIGTKIANKLNGLNKSQLVNDLKTLANTVWGAISDVLLAKGDDGNTLAYTLASKVVSFLLNAASSVRNLLENGDEGVTKGSEIRAGIKAAFAKWKTDENTKDDWGFAKKILGIIEAGSFIKLAGDIGMAVIGLKTAFEGLGNMFKWISGTEVGGKLLGFLGTDLGSIGGTAVGSAGGLLGAIGLLIGAMVLWHKNSEYIVEAIMIIKDAIWNKLKPGIEEASEAFTFFKDKCKEALPIIKEDVTTFVSEQKEKWFAWSDETCGFWENTWNTVKETATTKGSEVKEKISTFLSDTKDKWFTWSDEIANFWSGVWDGIVNTIKGAINGIIGFINSMISGVVNGINAVIGVLNKFSFTIPDWVGDKYGGKSIGFNISPVNAPQIPTLAKGAVIPPNKQFLAMLGDQTHGTNVEAPLSTIQEAVANVMDDNLDAIAVMIEAVVNAINNKDMSVSIGDKEIGQAAARYTRKQNLVKGTA